MIDMPIDATTIRYEVLNVLNVDAFSAGDTGILVLETAEGRVGLHMSRSLLALLGDEIKHALEREAPGR